MRDWNELSTKHLSTAPLQGCVAMRPLAQLCAALSPDFRFKITNEIPVYGQQEQSAYNGHFESTCYHPLVLFNREGDCLAAKLRPGNVHSAEGWEELLLPEIERQQRRGKKVVFRADAAFAKPEIYEALEARAVKYAIRLPANDKLEQDIAELLTRPPGRPSHKPVVWYKSFLYQAASWKTARRVVAKVEFHCEELKERAKQEHIRPIAFAVVYMGLGEKDQAFEWLQKAYEEHSPELIHLRDWQLFYMPLGSDPRYIELVKKVGLPME
jgi:Transposase DDE domain group 1